MSLIGTSRLTEKTDTSWATKRKSMGNVFYKGRMAKLVEIVIRTALDNMHAHLD